MTKPWTKLDHETKPTYMVTVTATDPGRLRPPSVDVTITVTNVNEAPEIMRGGLGISGLSSHTYAEDRRDPVATYTAVGPDSARARWSLTGADAGRLHHQQREACLPSGARRTSRARRTPTNNNVYMVTIQANDGTNDASRDVTVRVTDVDEMEPQPGTVLERYDDNGNRRIDQAEVEDALYDYFFGQPRLSQEDVEDVLYLYFFP